jgi:hypothetical protein
VLLLNLVACGSSETPGIAATQTRAVELGELATKTRELELTQIAMVQGVATSTQPSSRSTTLGTQPSFRFTPVAAGSPQVPTAIAPPPLVAVADCYDVKVNLGTDRVLQSDFEQWNRIAGVWRPIFEKWHAFIAASHSVTEFEGIVGNAGVIAAADAFLRAARGGMAPLQRETAGGRFAPLAADYLELLNAEARWGGLLLEAATQGDANAWNSAIEDYETVSVTGALNDVRVHEGCRFWESLT